MGRVDMFKLKNVIDPEEIRAQLPGEAGGVGFLFHVTEWDDLSLLFEGGDERSVERERALWDEKPFIASPIRLNGQVIGANIVCPVPPEFWLDSPSGIKRFRETQFFPALELARLAGLKMVALGGSTPYVCSYGTLLRDPKSPHITTGHAATAAMLKEWVMECCDQTAINFSGAKIALFGAADKLGSTVAKYLCYKDTPKEIILIDTPDKLKLLQALANNLMMSELVVRPKISIHAVDPTTSLPAFDGAILTSGMNASFLTASNLNAAKFWIDDLHSHTVNTEAKLASRDNTLYIDCFARGPAGLEAVYPFHMATKQDCFPCLAEGFVAWQEEIDADFVVGSPSVWTVAHTHNLLHKHGFQVGPVFGKNDESITAASYNEQGEREKNGV